MQRIGTRAMAAGILALFLLPFMAAAAEPVKQPLEACADQTHPIRVIVSNVQSRKGTITADLHGDIPEEFLKKRKKILRVRVPARVGSVEMCLPAPRPGVFAIGLYHDVNANKRFDKNFLGLPAEPYGISNNPGRRLGAPRHKDAAFEVGPEGTTLEIELRH